MLVFKFVAITAICWPPYSSVSYEYLSSDAPESEPVQRVEIR